MSSGYMGADATGTLPVQFCQKCGQALGTSWSIEGGLSFHPWCAPSVTRHHGAWSTDCNKTNLKVDELLARIAELEAKVASSLTEQRRLLADARAWRKTSEQAEVARLRKLFGMAERGTK